MELKYNVVKFSNNMYSGYGISKKDFECLEVRVLTKNLEFEELLNSFDEIENRLNRNQANSSLQRSSATVHADNISGLLAEHICYQVLCDYLGKANVIKPATNTSINQIDIVVFGNKTVEVRSSCARNGIEFALFAKSANDNKGQYFDVIGSYINKYKLCEIEKNFYMRVIYGFDINNFFNIIDSGEIALYITGGATREMMNDPNLYYIKHMKPEYGFTGFESDYKAIPLGKSLEFNDFISSLKQ